MTGSVLKVVDYFTATSRVDSEHALAPALTYIDQPMRTLANPILLLPFCLSYTPFRVPSPRRMRCHTCVHADRDILVPSWAGARTRVFAPDTRVCRRQEQRLEQQGALLERAEEEAGTARRRSAPVYGCGAAIDGVAAAIYECDTAMY